ncbi:hypothetical protein ABT56_18975 [Photobacterium aquae]|uniref:Uncharacterized protein n=1 Tax=Photobacterium aquae TaxID=1195763 RepID=A0A0J1GUV9_9GAMM|nr:hypothetical protein [Photobacterium aquae]KLV03518.1 hypothetical protein ABT56_18975 [Photobacterium aquae]
MAILFTKKEAMKDLPFIEDKALYKAVDLALWLYLDKHWNFKNAVNKAAEKHSVNSKIAIERLLRQVIPEEIFWDRMNGAKPKNTQPTLKETTIRSQKIKKMEMDAKNHVADITRR